jgi:glycosyltransferase involved in cell wall biosynthesis
MRVLIVQPSLQPPGGGNAPAAWMVQALKGRHEVTVLTWVPVDLSAVNEYYGTTIRPGEIRSLDVPGIMPRVLEALPTAAVLLKASLLFRHAKHIAHAYDVILCGHNEADFGPRSIQYVHYPARLRPRPAVDLRWYHAGVLLRAYYTLCERIAKLSADHVAHATTLANSTWTAALIERMYSPDQPVQVVYPPVAAGGPGRPWEDRENGFVCIGRIAPEKELERVVAIIGEVRQRMPQAHLHLIGNRGPGAYVRRVRALAATHAAWVHLHEDVSRATLLDLIAAHRYAIHGMREEHFGIAPAEAAAGGCIVFVPDGGGQVEIVGAEPRLTYTSAEAAVEGIVAVMADPVEQTRLRAHLRTRQQLFTPERFVESIREVVDEMTLTLPQSRRDAEFS